MKFEPEAWSLTRPQLGDLNAVLVTPAKAVPKYLLVLCHGFGAPGTDLVNLFDDILYYLPDDAAEFAYLCPEGPVDLEDAGIPGGRAWWRLNMAQLMQMAETNSFDQMRDAVPPELETARLALENAIQLTVQLLQSEHGASETLPVVVGGFSQGAMITTDLTMRGNLANQAGLIAYSGALICESQWRSSDKPVQGLPFIQSHGTLDQILPFETGRWLNDLLRDKGLEGKLLQFDGPHTIPSEAILQTAKLLHSIRL